MSENLQRLAERIRSELAELERLVSRIQRGWSRWQTANDDLYLDGVALNLHGFYGGLERLFELIAANLDHDLPQGDNWHQSLLRQMTTERPSTRPAVISEATEELLGPYRGFRHVARNLYSFKFDPAKLQTLVEHAPDALTKLRAELLGFAEFLDRARSSP